MDFILGIFLSIPKWIAGDPEYTMTLAISTLIAFTILGLCLALSLRNPGFMRKKRD